MRKIISILFAVSFAIVFLVSTACSASIDAKRLLLYWSCDDGKGETLKDGSGRGFDGMLKGKFEWVNGKINGGVRLQAGYGEYKGNVIESTAKTGEITLAAWLYMNAHSQWDGIISIEAAGGDCCEYRLLVSPGSGPYWNAGRHTDYQLAKPVLDLKTWYHFALTANGKVHKIFLDGKQVGEQADNFALPEFKDVTVYIGTGESPGTHPVEDAIIDEATIWDKALSEQEMQAIMQPNFLSVITSGKLATTWGNLKAY